MSSFSNIGCCSKISLSDKPEDSSSNISPTGKRIPLIVGLPPVKPAINVIRSRSTILVVGIFKDTYKSATEQLSL